MLSLHLCSKQMFWSILTVSQQLEQDGNETLNHSGRGIMGIIWVEIIFELLSSASI